VTLVLDPDAAELLTQMAGGPRQRGRVVSALIREKAQAGSLSADTRSTVRSVIAALERDLEQLKAELDKQA